MNNTDNVIDKDELIGVAVNLDSILYLIQDITEDYFTRFNPDSSKDISSILWEFSRNRAKAIYDLLIKMQRTFNDNEITPYWGLRRY